MKIGELSKRSGCSIQTIRHYEKEGLMPSPARTEGNFRIYDESVIENLSFIRNCRALDLTIGEIKQLIQLGHSPNSSCGAINNMIDLRIKDVESRISNLEKLYSDLQQLRRRCDNNRSVKQCGILDELSPRT